MQRIGELNRRPSPGHRRKGDPFAGQKGIGVLQDVSPVFGRFDRDGELTAPHARRQNSRSIDWWPYSGIEEGHLVSRNAIHMIESSADQNFSLSSGSDRPGKVVEITSEILVQTSVGIQPGN